MKSQNPLIKQRIKNDQNPLVQQQEIREALARNKGKPVLI